LLNIFLSTRLRSINTQQTIRTKDGQFVQKRVGVSKQRNTSILDYLRYSTPSQAKPAHKSALTLLDSVKRN
jgi:hypothetical protein